MGGPADAGLPPLGPPAIVKYFLLHGIPDAFWFARFLVVIVIIAMRAGGQSSDRQACQDERDCARLPAGGRSCGGGGGGD